MATGSVPIGVLTGIYLGILTGVLPALLAFGFGFGFRYVTGVTIPAFAVVVLALALAGVNGGLLALVDPTITQSANSVALMTAVVVVLMLSLYTHALGDGLATSLPHHLSIRGLATRTVSADVVDFVGGLGRVRLEVVGEVRDMEGYPPLTDDLRGRLGAVDWTFPADLPIGELQSRMAERYRSSFDLEAVDVRIDERGRTTVAAAPPRSGVSGRLDRGTRAVSFDALVPTGVARGDEVTVVADGTILEGTVVSARSEGGSRSTPTPPDEAKPEPTDGEDDAADDDAEKGRPPPLPAPTTAGGQGRITVAVQPGDDRTLLSARDAAVVVTSRGSRREFELVSLLRRSGQRVRRARIRDGSPLDGVSIGEATIRESYGVAVLAVRDEDGWTVGPRGDHELEGGDEVYLAGTRGTLAAFEEAMG